jgi:hypothetical protein
VNGGKWNDEGRRLRGGRDVEQYRKERKWEKMEGK